ncbi:hypothetical protein ACNO5E_24895 [Vibrio parahaemolyticus]|uniref:hypothetical protein n=1 Tax=Vibrio parahaemolyticus TaxID=670 RepID=UPI0008134CAE|nr:hypothetical protein [Vibrio parahaemolyticus]OCP68445.1 hypothetical protein AKH08_16680 [Vibrio parahaemolyticus]
MIATNQGLLRTANLMKVAHWGVVTLKPKESYITEMVSNSSEVREQAIRRGLKPTNAVAIYDLLAEDIVPCIYELTPLQRATVVGTAFTMYCEQHQQLLQDELRYWATRLSYETQQAKLSNELSLSIMLSFIKEGALVTTTPIIDDAVSFINSKTKVLELQKSDVINVMKHSRKIM